MTLRSAQETFRRLTIDEPGLIASLAGPAAADGAPRQLDDRTEALLRIGALVALDAPPTSYRTPVDEALGAGADLEDLLAVLIAVSEEVGSARITSAAPRIALAAGYDVEAALEASGPVIRGTIGPLVEPTGGPMFAGRTPEDRSADIADSSTPAGPRLR
jgi:4-carboxymuconolactone decarboxylase